MIGGIWQALSDCANLVLGECSDFHGVAESRRSQRLLPVPANVFPFICHRCALPGNDYGLLTAGIPQPLSTQKRAGADLRLKTRDNGAFEFSMPPGASACAFRFCVDPEPIRPRSRRLLKRIWSSALRSFHRAPCPRIAAAVSVLFRMFLL